MREASEQDRDKILAYLKSEIQDCIYLYIDIMNYGVSGEHIRVWLEDRQGKEQGEIRFVAMKYYDSFQLYGHGDDWSLEDLCSLLAQNPVAMISGRKDIIGRLEPYFKDYKATYGAVFVMDKYREVKDAVGIETATEADAEEIAELICSDEEIGGHYTVDGLAAQLADRIRTKTGRSYIIREDGLLVAHSATYAEAEGVAVVGGTIIRPESRNTNHYILLSNYMIQQLSKEHKTAYTFSVSEKMIRYHGMMHTGCGEYGKLVKI